MQLEIDWERQIILMISTKKILISILGFYQGGAEIMPIRIANELYRRGYKVEIHCLKKDGSDKIKALLDERIPIHYTDRAGVLAILILTKGFSVIHTHCVASQQLVARIKHRYPFINIRHIATSHGGYEGLDEAESRKAIVEIDKATDIWTYVAENNRETFDKVGIAEDKLVKIGNAMERIGEIFPIQLSQYMIPEDAIVFTVITRAVWKKCWQECIDTISEARRITGKNIHLILGGTGPIYDELMSKPLDDFVHLVGVVTNPCNLYASSYCGMLLSVRECAPLKCITPGYR